MTIPLRRLHIFTWLSFAIVLPVLWWSAIQAIPDPVWQELIRSPLPLALPVIVKSKQNDQWAINFRSDSMNTRCQVEVLLKKPLTSPNSTLVIYSPTMPPFEVGKLSTRGLYRFEIVCTMLLQTNVVVALEDKITQNQIIQTSF